MNEIGFSDEFKNAVALCDAVKALPVTSAEEHRAAGLQVESIRELEKKLEAEYKANPIIIQAKQIQAQKGELAAMLEETRKALKGRQIAWEDAEDAKRKAEEARLAAQAKKQAEEAALREAQDAQAAGDKDAAIAVLEAAVAAPAPVVVLPKTAPKTANRRQIARFRIKDPAIIPRQYLEPDEKKIGGVVRSLGLAANIPGIEVYMETV